MVLLDTNILVYAMNAEAEFHTASLEIRDKALDGEFAACLAPQVLYEYFSIVTRANMVASPLTVAEALSDVETLAEAFPLIFPPVDHVQRTVALMRQAGLSRRHIFDVGLVATMLANGVTRIYTFDDDYHRIPGITVLVPGM